MYVFVCNPRIVLFFIFLEGDKSLLSTLKLIYETLGVRSSYSLVESF